MCVVVDFFESGSTSQQHNWKTKTCFSSIFTPLLGKTRFMHSAVRFWEMWITRNNMWIIMVQCSDAQRGTQQKKKKWRKEMSAHTLQWKIKQRALLTNFVDFTNYTNKRFVEWKLARSRYVFKFRFVFLKFCRLGDFCGGGCRNSGPMPNISLKNKGACL